MPVPLFRKILIANRGEIALRVIEACRELGVSTVVVYSTADRDSLPVALADEAICIGPPSPAESYLDRARLITAAEMTGADAIHPGYGFLAESETFARMVEAEGRVWIGPSPESMKTLGDKSAARQLAQSIGVPVLPGSEKPLHDARDASAAAAEIGYPVLLKAAAGGGGRGMRLVEEASEMRGQFLTAREEALKAFGDGTVYLERFLPQPRHVEFQILGDHAGAVVHLGERECSIQRRHQKLVEEAPSVALTPELREEMGEAAVRLGEAAGYHSAGTVEFLLEEDGSFFFMEMNARIQVEHPVTEVVWGVDLVKLQIAIAAGERLALPAGLEPRGHAIECRINAEHPKTFVPSPGKLTRLILPGGPGVRIDSHIFAGYSMPPFYDSLIAKIIAFGGDREEARLRMSRALDCFTVEGIQTTKALQVRLMADPDFVAGRLSTRFMDRFLALQAEVAV